MKKKMIKISGPIVLFCVIFFQNCGGNFITKFDQKLAALIDESRVPAGSDVNPSPTPNGSGSIPLPPGDAIWPRWPLPAAPATAYNSLDTVDPNRVLPKISILVPSGASTTEIFPDTIDLANMAQLYLDGITNILLPENLYFLVPPGMVNMHGTPTSIFAGGAPNWGKTIQAMVMARRMSGYDLNDANGTLTKQLMSTRNMIDPNVNRNLISRGEGAWHVIKGANPENQMTTAVEGLMELFKQYPSLDLQHLIQDMITYHTTMAIPDRNDNSEPTLHYRVPPPGVSPYVPNSIGTIGLGDGPFVHGKTMRALGEWYLLSGDSQALSTATLISNFVRNYSNSLFWTVPPGFPEGAGEGHFAGHIHMYATALMGLLWEAEARLKKDSKDTFAWALVAFVQKSYTYIRDMHGGNAVALGNYGEICATADMIRLAVKMTELGAADYNEDIERWTRNQISVSQIRSRITIVSSPGDPLKDKIGEKVKGLFFEDATHVLAIPDTSNGQGDLTLQLVACGLGNVIHAIYDVWEHIVQFKGSVAQINVLMNRATWYLDVKSEIPYRGTVHVQTAADLGPIKSFELRIPDNTSPNNVQVYIDGTPAPFSWRGNFVKINSLRPNTKYTVSFPQLFRQLGFRQVRNQNQNWAESSYSPDPGNGQDYGFHDNLQENMFTGTFRGLTMVGVDHRPAGGIPLYLESERTSLAAIGAADVAAPWISMYRFRLKPNTWFQRQ